MSLPALVEAFEQACRDSQVASTRAAAEKSLSSFLSHPDAISLALAVTETTNSSVARFHAAGALHKAARERWISLQPVQRYGQTSLRCWLINNVVASPSLVPFERRALLRTAAFLTRRAYLEESPSDRDAFFATLEKTATSPESSHQAALAAIELMDLILDEFLAPTLPRSASGIEREVLVRARHSFASPNGDMVRLFTAAKTSLSVLLSTGRCSLSSQECESRAGPALSAIFKILATDAKSLSLSANDNSVFSANDGTDSSIESLDAVIINTFLGSEWSSIVDQIPELLQMCFTMTGLEIAVKQADPVSEVLSRSTQLITAIAAISQASYGERKNGASEVVSGILERMDQQQWCSSRIGAVRLAYAEVWKRISCAYGLFSVENLPRNYIDTFTRDTCTELDAAAVRLASSDNDEDVFSLDVSDVLLETWANLALQADNGSLTKHKLSSNIEEVTSHFIRMLLRTSGETAAIYAASQGLETEEDFGFDDNSIENSRLCVAAVLTRFVLSRMVTQIRSSLMSVAHRVFNWSGDQPQVSGTLDMFQEDMFFLIRFASAVLADEAKGENPSVPPQFMREMNKVANGNAKDSVQVQPLIHAIMEVAQGETFLLNHKGVHSEEASPRVGAAILDALSRVCRTYLIPADKSSAAATVQLVGGKHLVESGISLCFEKATEGLLRRGVESDVAESAALLLSHLAIGSRTFHSIRESNYWQRLLGQGAEVYLTLSVKAAQEVGRSLTTVLGDVVAEKLLIPAYNSLEGFANAQNTLADAAERALATVNLLSGAAMAEQLGSRTRTALLHSLAPDGIAVACAKAFGQNRPDVSRSLIVLADNIVLSNLPFLRVEEASGVVTNAVKLVALHTEIVGTHKATTSIDEVAHDVEVMFALLTHILDEAVDVDVGDACYFGLSTVLSIMSEVLIDLPLVSTSFFQFVTRLVCVHPEKLSRLPLQLTKQILQIIDVQRRSVDAVSERRGLEAIAALGGRWMSHKKEGPGREVVEEALRGFAGSIFNGLATGSEHTSNLDAAADALLPLIHITSSTSSSMMEELGRTLLASCGQNDEVRSALEGLARAASHARSVDEDDKGEHLNGSAAKRRSVKEEGTKSFREAITRFSYCSRNALLSIALHRTRTR